MPSPVLIFPLCLGHGHPSELRADIRLVSTPATNCAPSVPLGAEQPWHVGDCLTSHLLLLFRLEFTYVTPTTSSSAALQDQAQMAQGSTFFVLNLM